MLRVSQLISSRLESVFEGEVFGRCCGATRTYETPNNPRPVSFDAMIRLLRIQPTQAVRAAASLAFDSAAGNEPFLAAVGCIYQL